MVACVLDRGWTIEATAERFQVDAKTVRKWRDRFLAEGDDRSARSIIATAPVTERDTRAVSAGGSSSCAASGAGARTHIAHEVGLAGVDRADRS